MRLRAALSVMVIGVIALVGVVALRALVEGSDGSARSTFTVRPDSTIHSVRTVFDESNDGIGAFTMPDRYSVELWVYYGPDGRVSAMRSETRDGEDGALLQSSTLVGGEVVATDASTGEVRTLLEFGDARDLNENIAAARVQTAEALASGTIVGDHEVGGRALRVVERPGSDGGTQRLYVNVNELRVVRSESIDVRGVTVQSSETLVFEVLEGRAGDL